mmetsp:Transcript_29178/g.100715  ORF Transcript_29178/g.100715 Transcript_29178/m.100715 type:complete len:245 (+) Transcript_29178:2014-2748(+)
MEAPDPKVLKTSSTNASSSGQNFMMGWPMNSSAVYPKTRSSVLFAQSTIPSGPSQCMAMGAFWKKSISSASFSLCNSSPCVTTSPIRQRLPQGILEMCQSKCLSTGKPWLVAKQSTSRTRRRRPVDLVVSRASFKRKTLASSAPNCSNDLCANAKIGPTCASNTSLASTTWPLKSTTQAHKGAWVKALAAKVPCAGKNDSALAAAFSARAQPASGAFDSAMVPPRARAAWGQRRQRRRVALLRY